jgi:Holliday junction resolvase
MTTKAERSLQARLNDTPTEQEIQGAVMTLLTYNGFYVMRLNAGAMPTERNGKKYLVRMLPAGTPDLLALKGGKAYFFEIKKGENTSTPIQIAMQGELQHYAAGVWEVRSLDEVLDILETLN